MLRELWIRATNKLCAVAGDLNLGNSLLRGWICNREVSFVAIRSWSYHGHQQVSGAEIPEFERCVSSPTTFPLGGPILEEK